MMFFSRARFFSFLSRNRGGNFVNGHLSDISGTYSLQRIDSSARERCISELRRSQAFIFGVRTVLTRYIAQIFYFFCKTFFSSRKIFFSVPRGELRVEKSIISSSYQTWKLGNLVHFSLSAYLAELMLGVQSCVFWDYQHKILTTQKN